VKFETPQPTTNADHLGALVRASSYLFHYISHTHQASSNDNQGA